MTNFTHEPLGPAFTPGRILSSPSEMDWTQHTYWVDSKGPMVVISEQHKLIQVQGSACPPPPEVPEPSYAAAVMLTLCFLGRGLRRRPR